jgi:hypothetical protein
VTARPRGQVRRLAFRVGQANRLVQDDYREWKRKLSVATKRKNVGRVLVLPDGDLDESPRDAKDCLSTAINGGYKPTRDQATLTRWLDISAVRQRNSRSFRRLESAVNELATAIQADNHVATPVGSSQCVSEKGFGEL